MRFDGKPRFDYRGFYYCPDDEVEPDVIKTFHDVKVIVDGAFQLYGSVPCSPYGSPSYDEFMMWIDCGMPDRKRLGGYVTDKIQEYHDQWQDEQINNVILGAQTQDESS
jgi:hypothetical protein